MWKPTRLHAQQTSLSTPEILVSFHVVFSVPL